MDQSIPGWQDYITQKSGSNARPRFLISWEIFTIKRMLVAFTFQGNQLLHQPAFPPGSVVFMNDAFFSSFVQRADRFQCCLAGILNFAPID